jgi:ribonuclease HI
MKKSTKRNLPKQNLNKNGIYTPEKTRCYKISKYTQYANKIINNKTEPEEQKINQIITHLLKLNNVQQEERNNIIREQNNETKCQTIKELAEKYFTRTKQETNKITLEYIKKQSQRSIGNLIKNTFDRINDFEGVSFIEDQNKTIKSNPFEVKTLIKHYFENIFESKKHHETIDISNFPEWAPFFHPMDQYKDIMKTTMSEITNHELDYHIKKLGNNKAPGPDEITYENYKLIKDTEIKKHILNTLNHIIKYKEIPEDINEANVILLSKTKIFTGDPNKLRPITLLTTYRKILTSIINTRITDIINDHNILKNNNFGFMKEKSTANIIHTLKLIIDHSKLNNKHLYLALLDIQKAYDSVPLEAIQLSLKRIGAPDDLIELITTLHTTRQITIDTLHGKTDKIKPKIGLPQGDKISCILWNIFYDPLLTRLKSEKGYIMSEKINIQELTYADDLTIIAENTENLQKMVDITNDYLKMFNMKANPTKSTIVSNQKHTNINITLNDEKIEDVRKNNQLVRILGTFITLNGSHKETTQHAKEEALQLIKMIKYKYRPGEITTYHINAVIIPILKYRLQSTYIPPTTINQINSQIRTLVKQKYNLPPNTPNAQLYDREMNIKLFELQNQMDQTQITNTLLFTRSNDICGKITRQCLKETSNKYKTNNLLETPIEIKKRNPTFIEHITNRLYTNNLQFRKTNIETQEIATQLKMEDYNTHYKTLHKLKIKDIKDITLPSNPNKIQSYNNFSTNNTKNTFLINSFDGTIPDFYKTLIQTFATEESTKNRINTINNHFELKTKLYHKEHPPLNIEWTQEVYIWTDGSLKTNPIKMGAACIIINPETNKKIGEIKSSLLQTNYPSSTKAELFAQYICLKYAPSNVKITILTDSQVSIDQIEGYTNNKTTERNKLKMTNHFILAAIKEEINKFDIKPKFIKVKAHNNIFWNEQVDKIAKEAAEEPEQTIHIELREETGKQNKHTYLYQNNNIIEIYPTTKLKKDFQHKQEIEINNRIKAKWPDINTTISKQSTISTKKLNRLDTTHMTKQNFRQHILLNTLQTKEQTYKTKITKDRNCPRCHTETETITHVFTCRHTKELFNDIIQETKKSLISNTHLPNKHRLEQIFNMINIDNPETFLTKETAYGVINNNFLNNYKTIFTPFERDKIKTLQIILETWLDNFHEQIWKYRCNIIFKKTKPPYPIPKLKLKLNSEKRKQTFNIIYTQCKLKKIKLTFKKPKPVFKLIFRGSG